MTKNMLIDATHSEETRVAVVEGNKLLEFDYESKFRKPLKGSIFLAKVTRVEPSLQAAFVNFGGNRHGFLPFSEIHPDYFRIPIADREALMAEQQAALEEMEKEDEIHERAPQDENHDGNSDGGDMQRQSSDDSEEGGRGDDHMSGASDSETAIEEVSDDEESIEEIGGAHGGFDSDERGNRVEDLHEEQASSDFLPEDISGEGEPLDETHIDESQMLDAPHEGGEAEGEQQGGQSEGGEAEGEQGEGRGRGGRGGRYRGRGRGRHGGGGRHNGGGGRGRHRMAHNSRQVESFGGEEYDDNGRDRFRFNLRRKYKIQEVIKRGQIMLVQVSKEERGNKGAAVSTYLSLPGRYCVLMPNSPRAGGVSRKIASYQDRARMREIVKELETPKGMSVIVRTAGVQRSKEEIKRDLDYLMRLWDNIRELTLQSSAPSMVYGEADLIKRAVRDLYGRDINEVIVSGHEGFETAQNFMKMLVPTHTDKVVEYKNAEMPLFHKYRVEDQIAEIGEAQVTLPSGGYLVINQTEALVAIDVNSGKATKERHIEETALKTNMEAAGEVARQLRLRDLGGLVVIDFIDMEDRRNNAKVERKMRDALSSDRARIQMGRISSFGLMELSRQRLNPSLNESQFEVCKHCMGLGRTRTCDATSIMALRAIEEEAMSGRGAQIIAHVSNEVAIYILNNKRKHMLDIEARYGVTVLIRVDASVGASSFRIEVSRSSAHGAEDERAEGDFSARSENMPEGIAEAPVSDQDNGGRGHHRSDREDRNDRGDRDQNREGGRSRGGRGRRGGRNRGRGRDFNDAEGGERFGSRRPDVPFTNADEAISEGNAMAPGMDAEPALDDESENFGNRQEFHGGDRFSADAQNPRGNGGRNRDRGDRGGRGGRNRGGRGRNNNRGGHGGNGGGDFRSNRRDGGRGGNQGGIQYEGLPKDDFTEEQSAQPAFSKPAPAPEREAAPAPAAAKAAPEKRARAHSNDEAAEHARAFEKVNEPPKEKKRGWWSRGGE